MPLTNAQKQAAHRQRQQARAAEVAALLLALWQSRAAEHLQPIPNTNAREQFDHELELIRQLAERLGVCLPDVADKFSHISGWATGPITGISPRY